MPTTMQFENLQTAVDLLTQKHRIAWNTHDRSAYETLFTEDADFVNVVGQHSLGRKALADDFEHLHRTIMRNSHVELEEPLIRAIDDHSAIVRVRWSMTGVESVPGWKVPDVRHGRLLYVVVERGGEWKINAIQNTEEVPVHLPE